MPTVLDRLIQQAILQVLQRRWDRTFSEHSYGFRPGRSARPAVAQAQSYVAEGYEGVVDIDIEKFFDRFNDGEIWESLVQISQESLDLIHLCDSWPSADPFYLTASSDVFQNSASRSNPYAVANAVSRR
jgi:hypothetical protein